MGRREIAERFEAFVLTDESETGCWLWAGAIRHDGYGAFVLEAGVTRVAHRVSYALFKANIPAGLVLDHICMNKACVNPDHLEPVTRQENTYRARRFYGPGWIM